MISGGIFKFGHDQELVVEETSLAVLFFFFLPPLLCNAKSHCCRIELFVEMSYSSAVGMLRLSFILVARGLPYARGSVSVANGLCVTFCNVVSSNPCFCLPAWEGEKQAGDKCM